MRELRDITCKYYWYFSYSVNFVLSKANILRLPDLIDNLKLSSSEFT